MELCQVGRRACLSSVTEPAGARRLQRDRRRPTAQLGVQLAQELPLDQADAAGFGRRGRSKVRKPWATAPPGSRGGASRQSCGPHKGLAQGANLRSRDLLNLYRVSRDRGDAWYGAGRAEGRAGRRDQEARGHGSGSTAARAEHGQPPRRRPRRGQGLVRPVPRRGAVLRTPGLCRVPDRRLPGRARHHRQPLRPRHPEPPGPGRGRRLLARRRCRHRARQGCRHGPPSWRRPRTAAKASSPPPRSTPSATSSGSCTTPTTWRSCRRPKPA